MAQLDVRIPKDWDETFAELAFEDICDLIAQAQKSRAKHFIKTYTIVDLRRVATITIESRPR